MRYLSVCSGIEAATVAWAPLGWEAAAFAEIAPFPRAVLQHHYPDVPLHGDFTTIRGDEYGPVDLLVGGTPCQDFSIAGLRKGFAGDNGNLTLEFLRLAARLRPRWLVWENVDGVLSQDGGRAFGAVLGGLGELGYGFAYRVLDAQYAGLAQRRNRVFVVGCLGDWRRAAAVLFECEGLRWDPPPRRASGERVARPVAGGSPGGSGYRNDADRADDLIAGTLDGMRGGADENDAKDWRLIAFGGNNTAGPIDVATACNAHGGPHGRLDFETETFIAHAFDARQSDVVQYGERAGPLDPDGHSQAICFDTTQITHQENRSKPAPGKPSPTLAPTGHPPAIAFPAMGTSAVRRLTPLECERLQGLPDNWTLVPYRGKPAADGPRYEAIGNSMAVPVVRWIGARIAMVAGL